MIISIVWSAFVGGTAIYNYVVYGNCNGPDSIDPCFFNIDSPVDQNNCSIAPVALIKLNGLSNFEGFANGFSENFVKNGFINLS